MGSSATGILVYGVDLGPDEEFEFPESFKGEDDYVEFDQFIYKEAGLPDYDENATDEEHLKRWELQREAVKAYPVDLVVHGHHEYPAYIVAARGTEMSSNDWTVTTEVSPQEMLDMPKQREQVMSWMESHGFEVEEPRWLLCASYG